MHMHRLRILLHRHPEALKMYMIYRFGNQETQSQRLLATVLGGIHASGGGVINTYIIVHHVGTASPIGWEGDVF